MTGKSANEIIRNNNASKIILMIVIVGSTKKTQFLNFNLLIRILGQNILETNQKKNQPKILMFGPPLGGHYFAIQLILIFF